ncbi:MAG TPA: Maf family protein [bacterium]|nr:septum formation inhibitor Maf [bacterium]HOB70148.1 Maf family protein [bacterium]HQM84371.1 Maf family protein [bacterium]HRQ69899.1 Maf family protein [bacterium]
MKNLILASGSPRRLELLSYFGFDLKVIKPDTDETVDPALTPQEVVISLALQKGNAVAHIVGTKTPLLSADTIVVIDDEIINKPADKDDAINMISKLSGRTHSVFTGVAIFFNDTVDTFFVKSDVTFKKLSSKEISDYCDTDEPYDKAGAYAVQGIGAFMVKSINGSYSNVIGLPVSEVIEHFQKLNIINGLK